MTYPYCGTVSFFDGVMDYYCDSLSGSDIQSVDTTYSGETDGRTFTPVVVTLDSDTNTDTGVDTDTDTNTGSRTATSDDEDADSATTDPTDASTPTGTNESDVASSSSGAGAPSPSGGSSTNTGAIVGGVVGGVGGIALIALVAFLLIRRNKKKNLQQQQQQQQQLQQPPQQPGGYPPMQQQQPLGPQGSAPGHQSVYNPGYPPQQQQQYGMQPPQQGALPPGYYHQDPNKPGGFVAMAPAAAGVPDRNDSTSPVSQVGGGDNRASMQPSSPTSTVHSSYPPSQYGQPPQQQSYPSGVPPTVHEAGSNVVGHNNWNDNHHGQFHELPGRD